jgi:hypothetical protein
VAIGAGKEYRRDRRIQTPIAQSGFGDALLRNVGENGSRPIELAAHAGLTRQAIAKLVDELERLDLVRRDQTHTTGAA